MHVSRMVPVRNYNKKSLNYDISEKPCVTDTDCCDDIADEMDENCDLTRKMNHLAQNDMFLSNNNGPMYNKGNMRHNYA